MRSEQRLRIGQVMRDESFIEDALEKLFGVSTGILGFRFQRLAGYHQRFHSFYNDSLLGE